MICKYCEGKGKQFEALTMKIEPCLYCGGFGIIHCCEGACEETPTQDFHNRGSRRSFERSETGSEPGAVDLPCRLCDAGAVAIYYFDLGCVCCEDRLMALCEQHVYNATPVENMEFVCRPPGVVPKESRKAVATCLEMT